MLVYFLRFFFDLLFHALAEILACDQTKLQHTTADQCRTVKVLRTTRDEQFTKNHLSEFVTRQDHFQSFSLVAFEPTGKVKNSNITIEKCSPCKRWLVINATLTVTDRAGKY